MTIEAVAKMRDAISDLERDAINRAYREGYWVTSLISLAGRVPKELLTTEDHRAIQFAYSVQAGVKLEREQIERRSHEPSATVIKLRPPPAGY